VDGERVYVGSGKGAGGGERRGSGGGDKIGRVVRIGGRGGCRERERKGAAVIEQG